MMAFMGIVVIVALVVFVVLFLMRPPMPTHHHSVADHAHTGVNRRLKVIESIIEIDKAAGAAELEMFNEVYKHLKQRGLDGR